MAEPPTFIFITDEELRASLESDYSELQSCLGSEAWKAAHVISGAIVEAVLVDYLVSVGYSKGDPLTMTLEDLIKAGKSAGVLSDKAADLSTVIRGFRNLIHPGRVIRLNESVDEDGARVANALVSIIVREVAAKQAEQFGLTAEQLLAKFESDASAFAIVDHLLRDTQPRQLERLLLDVVPERYFVLAETLDFFTEGPPVDMMARVARLFVHAYHASPAEIQKKAAKRVVTVLRQETGFRVEIYEEHFFRGYFLEHLTEPEQRLVKDHLLSRLQGTSAQDFVAAVEGLSAYLKPTEVTRLFDPLIKLVAYGSSDEIKGDAGARLASECREWLPADLQQRVLDRLDVWVSFLVEKDRTAAASHLAEIRADLGPLDDDIPF